jgi:Flp pilus assembly protein TadG
MDMKESKGQSLVELGISLLLLMLLLLGAVELSLALFQYVTIRDAAQEGAIYGSVNPADSSGITTRALAAASDVLPQLTTSNVSVNLNAGVACEGLTSGTPNSLTVTVTFDHPITFPMIGPVLGTNTIALAAEVTNTILQPTCITP